MKFTVLGVSIVLLINRVLPVEFRVVSGRTGRYRTRGTWFSLSRVAFIVVFTAIGQGSSNEV